MQNQKFTEHHFLMTEFIVACILSPLLVIGEWFFLSLYLLKTCGEEASLDDKMTSWRERRLTKVVGLSTYRLSNGGQNLHTLRQPLQM